MGLIGGIVGSLIGGLLGPTGALMGTVVINGTTYEIYGNRSDPSTPFVVDSADEYLQSTVHAAVKWAALSTDDKNRALVNATRMIDRQLWAGTKTNPLQTLQWPRTGVFRADGTAVSSSTVPVEVEFACYELAFALTQNATAVQDSLGSGSNKKRLKAGSVEIEFFRPVSGTVFPNIVQELLGQFLAGSIAGDHGLASGATDESSFDSEDDGFGLNGSL